MDKGCFHCGDKIIGSPVNFDEKVFCCNGCKTVYEVLSENNLTSFYSFNEGSGIKPSDKSTAQFKVLDVPEIAENFISFQNDDIYIVTFFLPAIHCSSCVYLLENLHKLNPAIISGESNFTARTLQLKIKQGTPLSEIATLLDRIGYRPELRPSNDTKQKSNYDKKLLLKLGIAAFAFGSVMLWTLPDYLGLDDTFEGIRNFSAYLSLLVAIPVFFYSASDYLKSAYTGIKTKQLNLDIPIAIGIIVLFIKSSVSVLMQDGAGYMDSFTGFVFFLLIGKWFQSKTYRNMAFDNDPKAYFPLGVHRYNKEEQLEVVVIDQLKEGDHIEIYNEEIIPCDVKLLVDSATINASFITGEADLIKVKKGDRIYAGSKLIGSSITAEVSRTTNRSKFAGIWNSTNKERPASISLTRENKLTKYFLTIVFFISAAGAISWAFIDPSEIIDVVTAVLVVACPCALALSFPFVFGNAMRKFGNHGLYFKNAHEIEKLNEIDTLIFDKTGTLTKDKTAGIQFTGELTPLQIDRAYALTKQSTHPYSKSIHNWLAPKVTEGASCINFQENTGKGITGSFEKDEYKIGSAKYVGTTDDQQSGSYLSVNGKLLGKFIFQSELREGIAKTLEQLSKQYELILLSGDNSSDLKLFNELDTPMKYFFNQTPTDKKNTIIKLQAGGKKIAYFGDGLNDTEALSEATLGISVAEDVFRFTPSCDAILTAENVKQIERYFKFGKYSSKALIVCMVFSLIYNTVGMTFALMGYVTPLFAAILMPLSSITIVFISTLLIRLYKL